MTDWLMNPVWHDGKLFGIDWSVWKIVGWLGNAVFFSRFFVQWYATEKRKQVVVPIAFWWLSLAGGLTLFCYAVHKQDPVIIVGQGMGVFIYVRNLMLVAKRQQRASQELDARQRSAGAGIPQPHMDTRTGSPTR